MPIYRMTWCDPGGRGVWAQLAETGRLQTWAEVAHLPIIIVIIIIIMIVIIVITIIIAINIIINFQIETAVHIM